MHVRVRAEEKDLKKKIGALTEGMLECLHLYLAFCVTLGKHGRSPAGTVLQQLCSAYQGNQVKYLRDYFLEVMDTCSDS